MSGRTRRTTLTLDTDALDLAERIAQRRGISLSALTSRALRNEAIRLGAPAQPRGSETNARQDEAERAAMIQEEHGPGEQPA